MVVAVGQNHGELLSADARGRVDPALRGLEDQRELLERPVAGGMPEAVIQRLEVVKVEEKQRHGRLLVAVADNQALAARHESAPVERAGQRIGLRLGALIKL